MRVIFASFCLVVCVAGGCEHPQPQNNTAELSGQVKALTSRIEELESRHQQNSSPKESGQIEVDTTKAAGVFADATHVVAAGHNVVMYFATKNYTSGNPSEATARLSVYLNYYTAKRMQAALAMSVERHASMFGNVPADEVTGQPKLNDKAETIYANFVRLTASPEELVVDVGLNRTPAGIPTEPIPIAYTVIMDFHAASTLLRQVGDLIAEYEAKHGPLETDIQKRIAN